MILTEEKLVGGVMGARIKLSPAAGLTAWGSPRNFERESCMRSWGDILNTFLRLHVPPITER